MSLNVKSSTDSLLKGHLLKKSGINWMAYNRVLKIALKAEGIIDALEVDIKVGDDIKTINPILTSEKRRDISLITEKQYNDYIEENPLSRGDQKKLNRATFLVTSTVHPEVLNDLIEGKPDVAGIIYATLAENYEPTNSKAQRKAQKNLENIKSNDFHSITQYIAAIRKSARLLREQGEGVSDTRVKNALLNGLRPKQAYKALKTNIDACRVIELTRYIDSYCFMNVAL